MYNSEKNFKKAVGFVNGRAKLKENSHEYYQVQAIAEILNIPYVVFVFEHSLVVEKIVIKREFDFIWKIFFRLRDMYLKHIVPFYMYKDKAIKTVGPRKKVGFFSDKVYHKLLKALKSNED